jgi:hypothetical protein
MFQTQFNCVVLNSGPATVWKQNIYIYKIKMQLGILKFVKLAVLKQKDCFSKYVPNKSSNVNKGFFLTVAMLQFIFNFPSTHCFIFAIVKLSCYRHASDKVFRRFIPNSFLTLVLDGVEWCHTLATLLGIKPGSSSL